MLFEESGRGAVVEFSISSQPQTSGSPRSPESPKTRIRDVPDRCAMGRRAHVSISVWICGRLKQPELLSLHFVMDEKPGFWTDMRTCRVFV